MASNSSLKRSNYAPEEQLLLKEMHMKNSISITPSKQISSKYGDKKYVEPVRLTPAWEEKNLPNDVLNFKNVTMEQAELETNPPKDRFMLVYIIILIHGIGVLMPWNMFITAKGYFNNYKLNSSYTHTDTEFYTTNFLTFMGVFSQLPSLLFNWLNIFINFGGSLTSRIVYSIVVEVIIFIITEVLVILDTSSWVDVFFWTTMGSVLILNVANGIYQNTIYGIAARLPAAYTGAIILGNNISGIFTSIISILSQMLSPSPKNAAVYYFMVALVVLFICFDSYFVLPLCKFYKFHNLQFVKAQAEDEENRSSKNLPYGKILKKCWVQCFNVFFVFFVTLSVFPAVHSGVKRTDKNFVVSEDYYSSITCFLTFNVFAAVGNLLANLVQFPGPKTLYIPVVLRVIFIPLFLICNYSVPGRIMPVLISGDWTYWYISIIFALTSGYFSSLAMMYCGKTVKPEYSSVAGMFGAACLVTGICAGVVTAFGFPVLVRKFTWQ